MNLFHKRQFEDPLVPGLFGELSESETIKLFPEFADTIKSNMKDTVKQFFMKKANSCESRIQIIAWNRLRQMSIMPDESLTKKILGFVIEVGMEKGTDYLAVYADNSARYFNFSGSKIFYENGDNTINNEIQTLLSCCKVTIDQIGVWERTRCNPPKNGMARVNFLTPRGLFFGEGSMNLLEQDLLAKDIIAQSVVVMRLLITSCPPSADR